MQVEDNGSYWTHPFQLQAHPVWTLCCVDQHSSVPLPAVVVQPFVAVPALRILMPPSLQKPVLALVKRKKSQQHFLVKQPAVNAGSRRKCGISLQHK